MLNSDKARILEDSFFRVLGEGVHLSPTPLTSCFNNVYANINITL